MTSKQQVTLDGLKARWTADGVDLTKLTVADGTKVSVQVAEEWPLIEIGKGGGVVVVPVRSYANAFEAAVIGKQLLDKQKARDAGRAGVAVAEVVVEQKLVEEKKEQEPPKEEAAPAETTEIAAEPKLTKAERRAARRAAEAQQQAEVVVG